MARFAVTRLASGSSGGTCDSEELRELLGDWSAGGGSLYRKLANRMRQLVNTGVLRYGDRLPSERALAESLAVSRATVVGAYDALRADGVLHSKQGSGTTVARSIRLPAGDGRVPGSQASSMFQRLLDGPGEVISLTCAHTAGEPRIREAMSEVLSCDMEELLNDPGYHPRGWPRLRQGIADRYCASGLATCADEIVVTTGAQQALVLAAGLYLRPGSTVLFEAPAFPGMMDAFKHAGATLVPVASDADGVIPAAVAAAIAEHRPDLLYFMPSYNNPTGAMLSLPRRRQIADLAARHNLPIVEDDAYQALRADDDLPRIAALAPKGVEVLSLDSLGKSVWGGLRIGSMRAPAVITERLARLKALLDLGTPLLEQAVVTRLLPHLDQVHAERSADMAERLELLEKLLVEQLPDWTWPHPAGGASIWVELPDADAGTYAQVALRHGVEVVPGRAMDPSGQHDNFIRVPFTFTPDRLREMVARMAMAWLELRRHGPADMPLRPIL